MTAPPTTGSILSRAFSLFGAGAVPFLTIVALIQSPWLVYHLYSTSAGGASPCLDALASLVSGFVLGPIGAAALIYGVFRSLRSESVTVGECFRVGFARWLPVLLVSILVGLATMGGFLLLVIPGIVVACGLFVSVPSLIVEDLSPSDALRRSWRLTDGYKVPIFFVSLLLAIPGLMLGWFSGRTLGNEPAWLAIATVVVTVLAATLQGIAQGVTYHDIRLFREGLDEDELAAVFD